MTKHILITGGLGYIGNILFETIKDEGWHVEILDNNLYKELTPEYTFLDVDIRDIKALEKEIERFDIIVNLAAIVGDPACLIDPNYAIDINCIGTKNVAEICNKLNKFIIHFSTCSIYGHEPNKLVTEEGEGFPIDFYGQTKYTQERLVREICSENYCVLRLGTAYGLSPRMRYDLVVNTFAGQAAKEKKITIFGGQQKRPFVHIKDISRAVVHVIKEELKGVYNIPGENLSLIKLGEIVKDYTNCDVVINKEITDKRTYVVDSSKLINTGFSYKFHVADGIKEIFTSPTALQMTDIIYSNLKLAQNLKISQKIEKKEIGLINGGIAVDDRGTLAFANDFDFFGVKRFYQVFNFSTTSIRAFHGHLHEAKYVYVTKGSAIVAAVKLDKIESPSKNVKINRYVLSDRNPQILFIPPKYANGFRPLEKDTRIIFFSTSTLEESKGDDYRFPVDYWGKEIWEVENR